MNDKVFNELINNIKQVIDRYKTEAKYLKRYYEIGGLIINNQDKFSSKEELLTKLSQKLGEGYGKASLSDMRRLYETYKDFPEQFELAQKIGWSLIRTLLGVKNSKLRFYFQNKIINQKWSNNRLKIEIKNREKISIQQKQSINYDDFIFNIEEISINNFKSISNIKIEKPNKFSVFAGTNGSGKSAIFEALEMLFNAKRVEENEIFTNFGEKSKIINYNAKDDNLEISISCGKNKTFSIKHKNNEFSKNWTDDETYNNQFLNIFSRIFVDNSRIVVNKMIIRDKLSQNANNLIEILNEKIIPNEFLFNNFKTNLISLRPNIEKIDTKINPSTKQLELQIKEEYFEKPFNEMQISDGTMNIVSLLAILFQTKNPQFICIEEPENGLHPFLIKQFVNLCRTICDLTDNYIWFTTHSPVIVNELKKEELIIVNSLKGNAEIILAKDIKIPENLKMDDAWLTNHLKGGLPW